MPEVETRTVGGLKIDVRAGAVTVRLDEPPPIGDGTGATPSETLLAALSACAAMTLTMYAKRKQWPLTNVRIHATLERPESKEPGTPQRIVQTITLEGPLDAEQKKRLVEIAGKCPVHRTLEGPLVLEERLA